MRSYDLSMAMGTESARRNIKCFVECSTGMVYKPDSVPRKETDKLKPWGKLAKWKLQAEDDLAKIEGLNLVVLRIAHVYGPYARKFLSTMLCMARVYQSLGKEMRYLWRADLRTNTVHVDDAVKALWTAAEWYMKGTTLPRKPTPIFNVVDHGNTCKPLRFISLDIRLHHYSNSPRHNKRLDKRDLQYPHRLLRHPDFRLCSLKSKPCGRRGQRRDARSVGGPPDPSRNQQDHAIESLHGGRVVEGQRFESGWELI
jgi:nucleoside-diphosphate-sugar epimerase